MLLRFVAEIHNSFKKLSLLLFGLPLYSIESTFYCRKITIFNKLIIKSKLYSDYPFYDNEFTSFHSFSDFLTNTVNASLHNCKIAVFSSI